VTIANTRRIAHLSKALRQKSLSVRTDADEGFTLIELMVVLLIMAILLAIAIPTFLGVKSGAYDRSTQSDLTNTLTSARAGYASEGSYATSAASEVATLQSAEPNISFETGTAASGGTHPNNVAVAVSADGQELMLVGYSQSGTCWAAEDNEGLTGTTAVTTGGNANAGDWYGHWTESSGSTCSASSVSVPSSGVGAWGSHY
jgi:type IV pilus assembly protein PilA